MALLLLLIKNRWLVENDFVVRNDITRDRKLPQNNSQLIIYM